MEAIGNEVFHSKIQHTTQFRNRNHYLVIMSTTLQPPCHVLSWLEKNRERNYSVSFSIKQKNCLNSCNLHVKIWNSLKYFQFLNLTCQGSGRAADIMAYAYQTAFKNVEEENDKDITDGSVFSHLLHNDLLSFIFYILQSLDHAGAPLWRVFSWTNQHQYLFLFSLYPISITSVMFSKPLSSVVVRLSDLLQFMHPTRLGKVNITVTWKSFSVYPIP